MDERHEHNFVRLVGHLLPMIDAAPPLVIGITGSVAVGKSHFARALGNEIEARRGHAYVEVVSVDSFLYPNKVLHQRGLTMRKGFPESFDRDAIATFLRALRNGEREVLVPVYDHFTYDIVAGETRTIGRPNAVVVEGVALLDDPIVSDLLDVSIYLDADVDAIEGWYTDRFVANALRAVDEPGGFWDLFAGFDADQLREAAAFTWSAINLPNLVEHIEPTRTRADIVVRKATDHSIASISGIA